MTLRNNKWYVVYFFWCCNVLDRFTGSSKYRNLRREKFANGTNLCQFFRTLLFGTVIAILSLGLLLYAFVAIVILPFIVVGFNSMAMFIIITLVVFAAITLLVAIIWGGISLIEKINRVMENRSRRQTEPSLLGLAFAYMKAMKERYCPVISFSVETSNDD